ncbi:hypothetical protein Psi02_21130 [Planotetraspora silvatica]|uniref:4,4'-diaponeurosporenoate glycosyltransferase n=1 Tax=Planotetraspora silvatica TaxID=234614 RepID=A0A8J3UNW8_9ACTN|nr:glycosyltransferase [Planotetraspora silvatica]GII45689.1 hypothetical protein Psi02_21130 [Planotetraspora silvatica]
MAPIASVVIPAHNEERSLPRLLRALEEGAEPGELDVVVVANACDDRTAEVAAQAGVRVIETEVAGKPHALRLGDDTCHTFPRVYVDGDVVLPVAGIRALVDAVSRPGTLMAAPRPVLDLEGVSALARRVHRVWSALPTVRATGVGSGVFVLNEAGHAAAFPVPDVLTDDAWVHRSVRPEEKTVVEGARSIVRPAATVPALLRRRARVRLGHRELDRLGKTAPAGAAAGIGTIVALARSGEISKVDGACFAVVAVLDRALAVFRKFRGDEKNWSTDNTSRFTPVT